MAIKWVCVCVCVVTNKTTFDSYCCSHAAVSDTQDNVADYQMEPVHLTSKLLLEKVKSVYDYRCVISGAEIQSYVISLGVSKCRLPSFSLLYLCEIRSLPLTLALASNTAYCATVHTHPFNGPLSGTTRVSQYQKGKTNLDFTEARDSEWQWHQQGRMQVCTSHQTDNHTNTSLLSFLQAGCPSCRPTNSVKALKATLCYHAYM